jgi:molecular chaperone GrpE (heat shock protein)
MGRTMSNLPDETAARAEGTPVEEQGRDEAPPVAEVEEDLDRVNRGLAEALASPAVAGLMAAANPVVEPAVELKAEPAAEPSSAGAPEAPATPAPDPLADVVGRLHQVLQGQAWLAYRLDQLETAIQKAARVQTRELEALRRELLGDRKGAASFAILNAVVPALEQLRAVRDRLDAGADSVVLRQLARAADVLALPLRSPGFEEFRLEPGEPFDPARMHCDGTDDGPAGLVIRTARPGYLCQKTVILPARVLVGRPGGPNTPSPENSPDE